MTQSKSRESEPKKKPYVKPEVKQVPLKPEEAVLGACKASTASGPVQSACTIPVQCSTLGS